MIRPRSIAPGPLWVRVGVSLTSGPEHRATLIGHEVPTLLK